MEQYSTITIHFLPCAIYTAFKTRKSWKHLLYMCDVPYSPLLRPAAASLKMEKCTFLLGSLGKTEYLVSFLKCTCIAFLLHLPVTSHYERKSQGQEHLIVIGQEAVSKQIFHNNTASHKVYCMSTSTRLERLYGYQTHATCLIQARLHLESYPNSFSSC